MTDWNNPDAREALRLRDERDALLDRVLYLGGIVQAACDELGIHHDTSAAEVVAPIRALRAALAPPISAACHHPGTRTCGICTAPASPVSPAPDTEEGAAATAERERRRRVADAAWAQRGAATRCVHCDARIPDVSQVRCPECECSWDGD
jgi:hypothetical protein